MIRVNLLGLPKPKRRKPVVTLAGSRALALLILVVALVLILQFFRYGHLQEADKKVSQQIRNAQAEKVRLEGVRTEYERLLRQKELLAKRTNIIEGLKAQQAGPARLLEMLASTVSGTDMVWLTNFEQNGEKVTIEGVAMNAKAVADLMTHLKDSKAFTEMDLKETVQDSAVKDFQKFNFTFNGQLVGPAPTT